MGRRVPFLRRQTALWLAVIAVLLAPASPAFAQNRQPDREKTGGILGGVIGGGLGRILGRKGDRTVTTLIGVGIGALIGSQIGRALNRRDRARMVEATQATVTTGQPQNWSSDRASGSTAVIATDRRRADMTVPVLRERVTQLPPLDFINANYVMVRGGNILGGPGTAYRPVGALRKNDIVTVTGKVQNQPWYLISQNGVGTGFVAETSLRPTTAALTQTAAVEGSVENRQTQVNRTCRTVRQTVVVNGKEQSENVTACQTATGWEVA